MLNDLLNIQSNYVNDSCPSCNTKYVIHADLMTKINIHKNTDACPLIYEVVPVYGCEFECLYCHALGQEEVKKFLPVIVDSNYPKLLKSVIEEHKKEHLNPIYYYSPKSDCFQKPLLETGITREIIELFKENDCNYILVTKGVPSEDVFELMVQTKNRCQVIISYGMPNEQVRKSIEPMAALLNERIKFAKRCVDAGIQTAAILEPFLPFKDLSFVKDIMNKFVEIGVNHFAVDFARVTHICLERIINAIPQYSQELKENYILENSHNEVSTTAGGNKVIRYSPPKEYMLEKFNYFKEIAKELNATVSVCNSFGFEGFNKEAGERGYICMGINIKKVANKRN